MNRETVTVAVLFMYPTFVTWPINDIGGIVSKCAGRKQAENRSKRQRVRREQQEADREPRQKECKQSSNLKLNVER